MMYMLAPYLINILCALQKKTDLISNFHVLGIGIHKHTFFCEHCTQLHRSVKYLKSSNIHNCSIYYRPSCLEDRVPLPVLVRGSEHLCSSLAAIAETNSLLDDQNHA